MKTVEIITQVKLWLSGEGNDTIFDDVGEVRSADVLEALEDLMRRESALAAKCRKQCESLRVAAKVESTLATELAELAKENDKLREELLSRLETIERSDFTGEP